MLSVQEGLLQAVGQDGLPKGSGFRVRGLGFVDLGFRVEGLGSRA